MESKPKLFGNTLHLKQWEADDDQNQHQINAPFAESLSHKDKGREREREIFNHSKQRHLCAFVITLSKNLNNIKIQLLKRTKINLHANENP